MDRRVFVMGLAGGAGVLTALPARANLLRAGNDISLRCLGEVNGPRFLDGRTGDGSVGLAPATGGHFTGTKWRVWAGGNQILLRCAGAVEGPRWLDGRTADGTVGLAPGNTAPFSGTHWRVLPLDPANENIVALQCLGAIQGPRWLDGRTGNATVGLAANTNPPFSGTHWEARLYGGPID